MGQDRTHPQNESTGGTSKRPSQSRPDDDPQFRRMHESSGSDDDELGRDTDTSEAQGGTPDGTE